MKWPVDLELLRKYFPENEFVKITDEIEAKRENHKNYVKEWRENHKVECENHKAKNPENSPKNAISGENSVNFTHAGGIGGVLFNNTTCTPVDTVIRSNTSTKEKTYKKEKFENEFETFWTAWPRHFRKTDKSAANKAFCKAFKDNNDLTIETLLKALEWWKNSQQWQKDDGSYIPEPKAWLNQGKWRVLETLQPVQKQPVYTPMPKPPEPDASRRTYTPAEFATLMREGLRKGAQQNV